jgi:DNA-binding NarL/FixJ family response regulator
MRTDLSRREVQVLQLVSHGMSNGQIGKELFITEDTVKTHMKRVLAKLRARNRAHAVCIALRTSLIC